MWSRLIVAFRESIQQPVTLQHKCKVKLSCLKAGQNDIHLQHTTITTSLSSIHCKFATECQSNKKRPNWMSIPIIPHQTPYISAFILVLLLCTDQLKHVKYRFTGSVTRVSCAAMQCLRVEFQKNDSRGLSAWQTSKMSQHLELSFLHDKFHNINLIINNKRQITTKVIEVFKVRTTNVKMSHSDCIKWL